MTEQIRGAQRIVGGRYVVDREIGRGGMACVYLATDQRDGRVVALKMLRPEIVNAVNVDRFLREIQLTTRCRHPHILALLDSGTHDGEPYYVMPFVDGESLRQRLEREHQLPIDDALRIADQVADALVHAHAMGVVHRDISPGNVLLEGDRASLADFGIARAVLQADLERLTSTGIVIGTPTHMSPEQGVGERELDARSDLYSLASVIFEALAGVPPFTGPTPQSVLAQKAMHAPPSVRRFRPTVPEPVADALVRALQPVPADRFRSVAEFRTALAGGATPLAAPAAATGAAPTRRAGRRGWIVGGLGASILVATVLAWRSPLAATPERALRRATAALRAGDAEAAEGWLTRATHGASTRLAAQLWMAQQQALVGPDSASAWRADARHAASRPDQLGPMDRVRAAALFALAEGRHPQACAGYRVLLAADTRDVTAGLGLATCLQQDSAVVRDASSPSGWRLRSSQHEAVQSYQRLLEQLGAASPMKRVVYDRLTHMLPLEPDRFRLAYDAADHQVRFAAVPSLGSDALGDTLAVIPYPLADYAAGRHHRELPRLAEALDHARTIAWRAAREWTGAFPDDVAAHTTFAHVLELRGDIMSPRAGAPSALEEVRVARALSQSPVEQLQLREDEVRLLVKRGEFAIASMAADSVLARARAAPPTDEKSLWRLASMAALTGRAREAAALVNGVRDDAMFRLPDGRPYQPPPELAGTTQRLLAFSAMGAPVDSIRALRDQVERQIVSYVPAASRDSVRIALLARPASLAVPALGAAAVATLPASSPGLVPLQQALARGDFVAVRARLDADEAARGAVAPGAVQLDRAYHEAWLRLAARDTAAAVRRLDAMLEALPTLGASFLEQLPAAAALAHVMRLRTDIATAHGDTATAGRWRAARRALLQHADPELHP